MAASHPDHPWCDSDGDIIFFSPAAVATNEEVEAAYRAIYTWWAERDRPACYVTDLSNVLQATAAQRRIAAYWEKRFKPFAADRGAAALVVPNALVRGLVTAVYWITPPGYPYRIFSDRNEAILWARATLKEMVSSRQDGSVA